MEFSKYSAVPFLTELEEKVGLMNPFKEGTIKKIVEGFGEESLNLSEKRFVQKMP